MQLMLLRLEQQEMQLMLLRLEQQEMQLMLLRLEQQEMQLMLLVQAMAKQLQAPKLADHLAYMAAEADNKAPTLKHTYTEAGEYPHFCLVNPNRSEQSV
jgi:hypothetical protein